MAKIKFTKKQQEEIARLQSLIAGKTRRKDEFAERAFYAPNTQVQDRLEDLVRDLEDEISQLQKELNALLNNGVGA